METLSYQKTKDKMAINRPHISIITLNVHGQNSPIKRHRVTEWIKKQSPTIYCLQETHLSSKDKYKLKVLGWKMIFQANGIHRKVGVVILISDEIDFKIKKGKKDTEGHVIMIKGIMHQEDIILIKIYAPNQGTLKYVKQFTNRIKGKNRPKHYHSRESKPHCQIWTYCPNRKSIKM